MRSMRWAAIIAILLVLMLLLAGCGQRVPTRNATGKNTWGNTTPKAKVTATGKIPAPPTTTSPLVEVPITPTVTVTDTITPIIPPPPVNITANLTLIDEKTLVFVYNRTAYNYNLENPPLLIEYTLTVPNITKKRVERDPTTVDSDRTVIVTYPDPNAYFEVTVKDLETDRIIVRSGYAGQYDVSYSKKLWVRYPGSYYIEFSGNKVTAKVKFRAPTET